MEELPPLLRLPPPVRRRIYRFIGVVSSPGEDPHRFDLHGRFVSRWLRPPPKPSAFHGLLLSCRLLYTEAAALLYSSSRFILRYDPAHPDPLRPLCALTTTSLASLTSLVIILNEASCHHHFEWGQYHECCLEGSDPDLEPRWGGADWCEAEDGHVHQFPLLTNGGDNDEHSNTVAAAQDLLAKWRLAATHLSHITSRRLELGLVCDIDPHHKRALEIASLVTAPLRLVPQLRDCHIRLGKLPDSRLQQTAQDGALQACRIASPPYLLCSKSPTGAQKATLTNLPRELRLRILEYSDLIVPNRHVTWSRQNHRYFTTVRDSRYREHLSRFFRCRNSRGSEPSIGCFCSRRHAAFSSMCKCWSPPGPRLFLICRTLCQDARLTFFSGNLFIVHDYKTDPCWAIPYLEDDVQEEVGGLAALEEPERPTEPRQPDPRHVYPRDRFAASQFLREVVPTHCLAHLRFLELVFPAYLPETWPGEDHPAMQDWRATVDWLLQDGRINAPGLTVRLAVADVSGDSPREYHRLTITFAEGATIGKAHMAIVRSLKPLADNGLARFYAHLPHPWAMMERAKARDDRDCWLERMERAIKDRAERFVMGDRYDGLYANGRKEPPRSFWVWLHYGLQ